MPQTQKRKLQIGTSLRQYPTEEDSNWSHNFPQQIPEHSFAHSPTEPQQIRTRENNIFDEIPPLVEEDWNMVSSQMQIQI